MHRGPPRPQQARAGDGEGGMGEGRHAVTVATAGRGACREGRGGRPAAMLVGPGREASRPPIDLPGPRRYRPLQFAGIYGIDVGLINILRQSGSIRAGNSF